MKSLAHCFHNKACDATPGAGVVIAFPDGTKCSCALSLTVVFKASTKTLTSPQKVPYVVPENSFLVPDTGSPEVVFAPTSPCCFHVEEYRNVVVNAHNIECQAFAKIIADDALCNKYLLVEAMFKVKKSKVQLESNEVVGLRIGYDGDGSYFASSLIELAISFLAQSHKPRAQSSCHGVQSHTVAFSVYLGRKVMDDTALEAKQFLNWTRFSSVKDMFDCDFLIMPFEECAHWFLMLICPKQRRVWSLCSLQRDHAKRLTRVTAFFQGLDRNLAHPSCETLPEWVSGEYPVQQQANGNDCGPFVLGFCHALLRYGTCRG